MTADGCADADRCPVPDPGSIDLRRVRLAHLDAGRRMFRAHAAQRSATEYRSAGTGSTRFAPLAGSAHLYLADTRTTALLETVFHEVHRTVPRVIYRATSLAGRALSTVQIRRRTPVVDLRDPALDRLGLRRDQLVATTAAHHGCTRQWAQRLVRRRLGRTQPAGLLWNSRIAELAGTDSPLLADVLAREPSEVAILYRPPANQTTLGDPLTEHSDLTGGQGRLLVDEIAELLDAEVH